MKENFIVSPPFRFSYSLFKGLNVLFMKSGGAENDKDGEQKQGISILVR